MNSNTQLNYQSGSNLHTEVSVMELESKAMVMKRLQKGLA